MSQDQNIQKCPTGNGKTTSLPQSTDKKLVEITGGLLGKDLETCLPVAAFLQQKTRSPHAKHDCFTVL